MKLASFVVPALLVGTPAHAQDKNSEIVKIFSWATSATPAAVLEYSNPAVRNSGFTG